MWERRLAHSAGRRLPVMSLTLRYARYVLSTLSGIGFGTSFN
jgi:hypothetical protein